MARPGRFKPVNTPRGWRLNIPAKFSESGRRERHFFRTRELADQAAASLKEKRETFGSQARAIAPALAEQAHAAAELLKPYGITVLEAAHRVADVERRKLESATMEAALDAFTLAKEDRSESQIRSYRYMSEALRIDFAGRIISTITGQELAAHTENRTGGPAAYNLRLRLLTTFWRWCARPPRQWCDTEPVTHFERKDAKQGEIGILTPPQAKALMEAAEKHFPETVPAFAIALFTGMRQAEIERLDPEDITDDGITVPAASSKTGRRRFIEMPAPLAAWLKVYPVTDAVLPTGWGRKERAVRRLAGFRIWTESVEPNTPPGRLPEWPNNALRHTAATVALAIGKSIERLVFEHGHSGGLVTLKNHYVGRMTKKQALAIWSLGPRGKKLKTIEAA